MLSFLTNSLFQFLIFLIKYVLGMSKRTSTGEGLTKPLASPRDLWLALVAGRLPPQAGTAFKQGHRGPWQSDH